jgi:hypothetical protein
MAGICPVCKRELEPLAAVIGPYHAGCAPLKEIAADVDPGLAAQSICWDCARAKGGECPDPHVVTGWIAFCIVCGKATGCTHVRDFRWPDWVRPAAAVK